MPHVHAPIGRKAIVGNLPCRCSKEETSVFGIIYYYHVRAGMKECKPLRHHSWDDDKYAICFLIVFEV